MPEIHLSLKEDGIVQFGIKGFAEIVQQKYYKGTIVKVDGTVLNIQNVTLHFCYNKLICNQFLCNSACQS